MRWLQNLYYSTGILTRGIYMHNAYQRYQHNRATQQAYQQLANAEATNEFYCSLPEHIQDELVRKRYEKYDQETDRLILQAEKAKKTKWIIATFTILGLFILYVVAH